MSTVSGGVGPHARIPMVIGGCPPAEAAGAVVVLHGRGGRATDLMDLAGQVVGPRFALIGPEAFHGTWYPHRFMDPDQANEPFISSAVSVVDDLVSRLVDSGIEPGSIALLGFSQGACLALECAGRSTTALGSVVAFSGGLIGATLDPTRYRRHEGMTAFLSCAEQDTHIPIERVHQSASLLRQLGVNVALRVHRGGAHGIQQIDVSEATRVLVSRGGPARLAS